MGMGVGSGRVGTERPRDCSTRWEIFASSCLDSILIAVPRRENRLYVINLRSWLWLLTLQIFENKQHHMKVVRGCFHLNKFILSASGCQRGSWPLLGSDTPKSSHYGTDNSQSGLKAKTTFLFQSLATRVWNSLLLVFSLKTSRSWFFSDVAGEWRR